MADRNAVTIPREGVVDSRLTAADVANKVGMEGKAEAGYRSTDGVVRDGLGWAG